MLTFRVDPVDKEGKAIFANYSLPSFGTSDIWIVRKLYFSSFLKMPAWINRFPLVFLKLPTWIDMLFSNIAWSEFTAFLIELVPVHIERKIELSFNQCVTHWLRKMSSFMTMMMRTEIRHITQKGCLKVFFSFDHILLALCLRIHLRQYIAFLNHSCGETAYLCSLVRIFVVCIHFKQLLCMLCAMLVVKRMSLVEILYWTKTPDK